MVKDGLDVQGSTEVEGGGNMVSQAQVDTG